MRLTELTGQRRVTEFLSAAVSRGRLAQAYLFTGPEGAGKRRAALGLAQAVLCRPAAGGEPCGGCPDCLAVERERHPDLEFFRPQAGRTSYPVKQIREEIRGHAYLRPSLGPKRFLVLEKAEALTKGSGGLNEGADTLLKLLEEPAPDTIVILLSSHPERLPETVRSRCHEVRFDPPPPGELAAVLAVTGKLDPTTASFAAHLAGGDAEVAQGFLRGKKKERLDLGAIQSSLLRVFTSAGSASDPDLFAWAEELDRLARGWPAFTGALGVLAELYRDAALRCAGVKEAALAFPEGPAAVAVRDLTARHTMGHLMAAAGRTLQAQEESRRFPARLLLLEVLLLDLKTLLDEGAASTPTLGVSP